MIELYLSKVDTSPLYFFLLCCFHAGNCLFATKMIFLKENRIFFVFLFVSLAEKHLLCSRIQFRRLDEFQILETMTKKFNAYWWWRSLGFKKS